MNKPKPRTCIHKILKALREGKNISQKALAAALGMSQQAVAVYESGGSEPPLALCIKYADYFGVSIDYLVGRETAPQAANVSGPVSVRDTGDHSVTVAGSGNTVTAPAKDAEADKDAIIDRLSRAIAALTNAAHGGE